MAKKLLAQVGLAALTILVGTGVALADGDSTDPGVTQDSQSVVTYTGTDSSSVSIQSSQSSTQSVGGSSQDGSDGSSGSSGSAIQSSGSVSTGGASTNSQPSIDTGVSLQASAGPTEKAAAATSSDSNGGTNLGTNLTLNQAQVLAVEQSLQAVSASGDTHAAIPALAPIEHSAGTPNQPGNPSGPTTPVGLLGQLQAALSLSLAPLMQAITWSNTLAGLAVPALIISLLAALAMGLALPFNAYTARLRRAGFLGAPRSDVGDAVSIFATPQLMDCIPALQAS